MMQRKPPRRRSWQRPPTWGLPARATPDGAKSGADGGAVLAIRARPPGRALPASPRPEPGGAAGHPDFGSAHQPDGLRWLKHLSTGRQPDRHSAADLADP